MISTTDKQRLIKKSGTAKVDEIKPRFCSRLRNEATQTVAKRVVGAIF